MTTERGRAAAVAGGAFVGTVLANLLNRPVAAETGNWPPELLDAIAALLVNSEDIRQKLQEILAALSSGGGSLIWPPNPSEILTFRAMPVAPNIPLQLPEYIIPNDKEFCIKALPGNVGLIYVGNSAAESANPNSSWPLIGNEAIHYKIHNTRQLWLTCNVIGEGAVCTSEYSKG